MILHRNMEERFKQHGNFLFFFFSLYFKLDVVHLKLLWKRDKCFYRNKYINYSIGRSQVISVV